MTAIQPQLVKQIRAYTYVCIIFPRCFSLIVFSPLEGIYFKFKVFVFLFPIDVTLPLFIYIECN